MTIIVIRRHSIQRGIDRKARLEILHLGRKLCKSKCIPIRMPPHFRHTYTI